MNRSIKLLLIATALALGSVHAAEPQSQVQDSALDDHTVYVVPVSAVRVTTISFPSPIEAIDGALITTDGKTPGLFQLAHANGTSYFSVRALAKGAVTNVNVRWNERTYVFELRENTDACRYSLILQDNDHGVSGGARSLTPNRLLGLMDKAKAFPLLQQYHPDVVREVEHRDCSIKPLLTDCGDYQVKLIEAFRFPKEDTLVFRLSISNKGDKPIQHYPERLQIRVGGQIFTPSVADLPTIVAPHGDETGYVAVSGNSEGGQNDLSLKNDFSFILARLDPKVEAAARGFDAVQTMTFDK